MSGLLLLGLAFLWLAMDYRLVRLATRRLPASTQPPVHRS
jgi:hypothetical protein